MPLQIQPIEQMEQSQLQQQLQPFNRVKSFAKNSPLTYSCISPEFLHFLSTKWSSISTVEQQQQQQQQQRELQQLLQSQNSLFYDTNHLSVMQNVLDQNDNRKKNCLIRATQPLLPSSMPKTPLPRVLSNNENINTTQCCCSSGGGGPADSNVCHRKTNFSMPDHFFDSLRKIHKNLCLTTDELCVVQENLWKLLQNSRIVNINHNIECMLEQNLLNDRTMTFLQSLLRTTQSKSKLRRQIVRQFLQALHNANDLVNNYFHPWALLTTNDPYELAQLNGVLSMNLKDIYESPNKWLYIKNFLIMLCQNKSMEDIVDYFFKRISKELLSPQSIDVLERIIKEKSLNLSHIQVCHLQNALKECSKRLFHEDPILNREYALKATKAPTVKDFETAYTFTKVLSALSLRQINTYLRLDDIKDIITEDKLKRLFDYVNKSDHDLNTKHLQDIVQITKEADMQRYTWNNYNLQIAITNLQNSSDNLGKLYALADIKKQLCMIPTSYLENILKDLRKYKILECQHFNDIYMYMDEDKGKDTNRETMVNVQRVKEVLKDVIQACQPLQDININDTTSDELSNILQRIHTIDSANYVKDLEINQLNTPEDYRKLLLKLSYMQQPNDVKRFCKNLRAKQILPNNKILTLQNTLESDAKTLRLSKTKSKELKKLLQNLMAQNSKHVAYMDDVSSINDIILEKSLPQQQQQQQKKKTAKIKEDSNEEKKQSAISKQQSKTTTKKGKSRENIILDRSKSWTKDDRKAHQKLHTKVSTTDLAEKKPTKFSHFKFDDIPTDESKMSTSPTNIDKKSRLSILFYRDMQKSRKLKEIKQKSEQLTTKNVEPVDVKDPLDKHTPEANPLEKGISFIDDHLMESSPQLAYDDDPPIPATADGKKFIENSKETSKGTRVGKYTSKFHFHEKVSEGRRLFKQKRSAHTLLKDHPYLKAVIQVQKPSVYKSATHLRRRFPKLPLLPKQFQRTSESESEQQMVAINDSMPSLPDFKSIKSEKFSPTFEKEVEKFISDISLSGHQLQHKIRSVTNRISSFKFEFENHDDYIAFLSKLATLDKRSSRACIINLHRKRILDEARLRTLQETLKEHELEMMPKGLRNSIMKTVDFLLEDETFHSLLNELKIEYLRPIYLENYAIYKFRRPTPQCHPQINIKYKRGLANFIQLVRRTVIFFWGPDKADLVKMVYDTQRKE